MSDDDDDDQIRQKKVRNKKRKSDDDKILVHSRSNDMYLQMRGICIQKRSLEINLLCVC